MNTYSKYVPNVFLAKCSEKHEKGEVIEVTTKYGKENECIVFNLIYEREGFYYYSIVRADGFNVQEWAKQRAERRHGWAQSAGQKSNEYFNRSNKDKDFLSLGEPIKVGHHSEKRHRKAIALRAFKKGAEWQSRQSPWISVEERLPEPDKEVLLYDKNSIRHYVIGWLRRDKGYNKGMWALSNGWVEDKDITHWMPIPSFDEILEANKDVLERIKEKGD